MKLVDALEMAVDKLMEHPTYTDQEVEYHKECAAYMTKEHNAIDEINQFIKTMQRR